MRLGSVLGQVKREGGKAPVAAKGEKGKEGQRERDAKDAFRTRKQK